MKTDKKEQKNLKEKYRKEMEKFWNDPKMANYCTNKIEYFVQLESGLLGIEKQRIRTSFYFPDEPEESARMAEHAKKSKRYFTEKNLEDFRQNIRYILEAIKSENYHKNLIYIKDYQGRKNIATISWSNDTEQRYFSGEHIGKMNLSDAKKLLGAYWQAYRKHYKKIKTYLKRYQLTKITTGTYWENE